MIGIPRDSWVSIPGYGSDRINAALYYGGPQLMADTVGRTSSGVQPDYVVHHDVHRLQGDDRRASAG